MDALTLALALLVILGLAATAAGAESRDGFDRSHPGRSSGH
jgi:hypothetical protein